MRSIGTLSHENQARKLIAFLKRQKIDASCEMAFDPATAQMSYTIWVHDEDQIPKAQELFAEFLKNSEAVQYETPIETEPTQEIPIKRASYFFTTFMIALCVFVFLINLPERTALIKEEGLVDAQFSMTQVEETLLIDIPQPLVDLDQLFLNSPASPSQQEVEQIMQEPFWRGAYSWLLNAFQGKDPASGEGPFLQKVREGEVWRLFTPCLLHRDLLHILFNMIWVWILGRPIEHCIGMKRTLALTLATGIGSNLAQYLMSGALFLGYSGVVTGLAGFIWMREKIAPWEGYPVHRATLLFLAFFVGIFFLLQLGSFLLQIFTPVQFEAGIANTAHIAGAMIGIMLGKWSFFKRQSLV